MKKLFVILAIVMLALLAIPAVAAEPSGPPGDIFAYALPFDSATIAAADLKAVKEVASIDFDLIAVSACAFVAAGAIFTLCELARNKYLRQDLPKTTQAASRLVA